MTFLKVPTPAQALNWYRNRASSFLPLDIWMRVVQDSAQRVQRLCEPVSVSLTSAAQTTLWTPQDGYVDFVTAFWIKGATALSGGTAAVLKIGLAAESYASLNGTTGHTLTTADAATWPAVGKSMNLTGFYPEAIPSTMEFTDAAAVVADVSSAGGLPTAGAVSVIPLGIRIPENLL